MKKLSYLAWLLTALAPVSAFAVDVVRTPLVNGGDLNFDYKGKYQDDENPRQDNIMEHDLGVGYGVTDRWRTRLESEFEDTHDGGMDFKYIGLANTISLTGNDAPLPTAVFLNVVFANHVFSSDYATAGLAAMKDVGPIITTANLFFKHEFGSAASGRPSALYRLQTKYDYDPALQPGMEFFGDTNKQAAIKDQIVKAGPGIFGTFQLGSQRLGYELVYLFGATNATPDGTLKWRLSYTFP